MYSPLEVVNENGIVYLSALESLVCDAVDPVKVRR